MAFPQVASITQTAFTSNATQHLVAMPATVNAGDLLIICAAFDGNVVATNPSGWTELENAAVATHRPFATAKIADGTEDGTTVDVVTAVAEQGAAQVYRITGWFGTLATGLAIGTRTTETTSTTNDPPALDPASWAVEDTLWIAFLAVGAASGNQNVSTYPTNYTNGTETDSEGGAAGAFVATARRENATGSEDAGVFTLDAAPAGSTSRLLAVRPAAAGGTQALTGALFTKAPTFSTGAVTATYSLTGSLFAKAPTFFTGVVTPGTVTLTGTLFTKAPTFPTGVISQLGGPQSLTGVLFQKAPTFPQGTLSSVVALSGVLFVKAPTFFTGTIGQAGTLFGNLFQKAPTFFTGSLAQGGPSFWTPNPAAYVGVTRYGPSPWGAELSGQRFEKAPSFPAGVVS